MKTDILTATYSSSRRSEPLTYPQLMVPQTTAHEQKPSVESVLQAYQHLLVKHRQQLSELELQEDNRTAEILCDHWKVRKVNQCFIVYYEECSSENPHYWIPVCYLQKLRTSWSKRFGELAKDIFIRSVPAQSNLSAQCCEELWVNLEQGLGEQLQEAECAMKLQLEAMTAQLNDDEKVVNQQANHQ